MMEITPQTMMREFLRDSEMKGMSKLINMIEEMSLISQTGILLLKIAIMTMIKN